MPNFGDLGGFHLDVASYLPGIPSSALQEGVSGVIPTGVDLPQFPVPPLGGLVSTFPFPDLSSAFAIPSPSTVDVQYPMPEDPNNQGDVGGDIFRPDGGDSSSLQKFISQVTNRDWAMETKYLVTLPMMVGATPDSQQNIEMGDLNIDELCLYCDAAMIPGIVLETKGYHTYGPDFQRPQNVSYGGDAISFQFMVDQDFFVRQYFESWMRLITNPQTYHFQYPNTYMTSGIVIKQLKRQGQDVGSKDVPVYSIRLIDAFPKAIQPMTLQYGNTTIHRLQVTFAYSRWLSEFGTEEPKNYFSPIGQIIPQTNQSPPADIPQGV